MSLVWLSSVNCLEAFLCIVFRRGFLLGRQSCRPIWCSVWHMVWALTGWPPTLLTSAAIQHSYGYFPNTTSGYGAEHVHSTSLVGHGEACSEWVLLNHCMVLSTVLQLSFRVLTILYPTPSLYKATIIFFRSSESFLPWDAILNFQWPVWESESDNTKCNTPAPHSHLRPCNTNESHDTGERKWLIGPN